jgi:23S rRNA (adenine2503-C2)-methyltransferase
VPVFLKDLTREDLITRLSALGEKRFRATQLFKWLYQKGVEDFFRMSDISRLSQERFVSVFLPASVRVLKTQKSRDGTEKLLYGLHDGQSVEGVLIPDSRRMTLCVSTQVGCKMGCAFCRTAKMGWIRNLSAGEIVDQVCQASKRLGRGRRITNVVFMGMGEPLDNLDNVQRAIEILGYPEGFSFSHRRITVSTCGLVGELNGLGMWTKRFRLAVSLNAADNETRNRLMPVNRRFPIEKLLAACQKITLRNRERVTFEYILLKGVNDGLKDARALARLVAPLKAKVNLIPFNETENIPFKRTGEKEMLAFQEVLLKAHLTAIIRDSRGRDIAAACGQLCSEETGSGFLS